MQPMVQPAMPQPMQQAMHRQCNDAARPADATAGNATHAAAGLAALCRPRPAQCSNPRMMGGDVSGRLLNKGRPLVNCHVVIVPLQEADGAIRMDEDRKPLTTVTDENGEFHFEDVPAGGYKLTWLPDRSEAVDSPYCHAARRPRAQRRNDHAERDSDRAADDQLNSGRECVGWA